MNKFLKTCHIISRVFVYLCVILVLLLYFFKPGIMEWAQTVLPAVDNSTWLAVVTALSLAAVLFATSELSYKSLQDNEFLATLSSSLLQPAFEQFEINDGKAGKTVKSERELNENLRDISDGKERVVQELAWEKQHSKTLLKRTLGNKVASLFFLVAGLAFFLFPVVYYLVTKRLFGLESGTPLDYVSIVALILTMVIVFESGNTQGLLRRLNTILAIRGRSDDLSEKPVQAEAVPSAPVYLYSAPAPVVSAPVSPAPVSSTPVNSVPAQEAPAAAPAAPASAPLPPEEIWHPETWSGVPEETAAAEEGSTNSFIHLTPEVPEESEAEDPED